MCDTIQLDNWTRVVYTNAMAGILLILVVLSTPVQNEVMAVRALPWNANSATVVFGSCVIGVGASHSAYVLRSTCSTTLSAVVGIVCKVITVLLNMLIWDKHASGMELGFVALGLLLGACYKQAPMRPLHSEGK
jgi:GDP-mannose transporter